MALAQKLLGRHHAVDLVTVLRVAAGVVMVVGGLPTPAWAQPQCGGTPDCPSAPLPLQPGVTAHTEMDPGGNFFALDPPANLCYPADEYIAGVNQLNVGLITETVLFINPTAAPGFEPTIQVPGGNAYPVNGSALHAAGVACVPGIGDAFAITDTTVGSVWLGQLIEHDLPPGSAPLSAALVAICYGRSTFLVLCVETSDPSIETYLSGLNNSYSTPGTRANVPDSYTNGQYSGVIVYNTTVAYRITGGVRFDYPYPAGRVYASHLQVGGSMVIYLDDGSSIAIPLPSGAIVVPFSPCSLPLQSCPAPSGSGVAVNLGPCSYCGGATATWPALGVSCVGSGGLRNMLGAPLGAPPPGRPLDKRGYARAYAWTTLGHQVWDPLLGTGWGGSNWNSTIVWFAAPPPVGAAGTMATAFAWSAGGGDHAISVAAIGVAFDVALNRFTVWNFAFMFNILVHTEGHRARSWAIAKDPFVFEDWDDTVDLEIEFALVGETYLPMSIELHPFSADSLRFEAGSTLPDLTELYELAVNVTHDGVVPVMAVEFNSNPLLGLDDAAVATDVANAFSYDLAEKGFVVPADTSIFTATIDIPAGIDAFGLDTDTVVSGEIIEPEYSGPAPTPPTITPPPTVYQVRPHGATIVFLADEEVRGKVYYGLSCNEWTGVARSDDYSVYPTVELTNLDEVTTYYFAIKATDLMGEHAYDDDAGNCYTFTTLLAGDHDQDGDVDLDDFAGFPDCLTGPDGGPAAEGCEAFGCDTDNDVDLADFAWLQWKIADSEPVGACCIGTSCTSMTEAECDAAGGVYQGDDTECDLYPCTGRHD